MKFILDNCTFKSPLRKGKVNYHIDLDIDMQDQEQLGTLEWTRGMGSNTPKLKKRSETSTTEE